MTTDLALRPYIGLRAFGAEDAAFFFGREHAVQDLLVRLREHRLVAVIGSSGAGKSSLVRAGLVPALEGGLLDWDSRTHWTIVEMRPGDAPIGNLAAALAGSAWGKELGGPEDARVESLARMLRGGGSALAYSICETPPPNEGRLLLVIDQFEELFRYQIPATADSKEWRAEQQRRRAEAHSFVELITAATHAGTGTSNGPLLHIVLTMRLDYLADCGDIPELADCMNRCLYVVPRLTDGQLMDAITLPAQVVGGEVERELATALLEEFQGEPDALPVLQHALMRCWEDAAGPATRLTLARYKERFGSASPLVAHLDEIYGGLSDEGKKTAEAVFRRLTEFDRSGREKRAPATMGTLARAAGVTFDDVKSVVEEFRQRHRDVLAPPQRVTAEISESSVIDISHEAIMRRWPRLKEWMGAEKDMAASYLKLVDKSRRRAALSDSDLDELMAWKARHVPREGWAERYSDAATFARASRFLAEKEKKRRRDDLARAIKEGEIRKALKIVREGVRLEANDIPDSYMPHYFALVPDAIAALKGDASLSRLAGQEWTDAAAGNARDATLLVLTDAALQEAFPDAKRIEPRTLKGFTVAHYAAAGGNVQVLDRLDSLGETFELLTEGKSTVFDFAVLAGQQKAALWLHEKLQDEAKTLSHRNQYGYTPLFWAITEAHYELAEWLLQLGAEPADKDTQGYTVVHWAAWRGRREFLELLVDSRRNGAVPIDEKSNDGVSPLCFALQNWDKEYEIAAEGRLAVVQWLLERGADATADVLGTSCLLLAIQNDSLDAVLPDLARLLVQRGARIDQQDASGEDAITQAVRKERADVLELLLDGALPTADAASRARWLRAAVESRSVAAANVLINREVRSPWVRAAEDTTADSPLRFLRDDEVRDVLQSQLQDGENLLWPLPTLVEGAWTCLSVPEAAQTLARVLAPPHANRWQDLMQARGSMPGRPYVGTSADGDRSLAFRIGDRLRAVRVRPVSFYPEGRIVEALLAEAGGVPAGCLTYVEAGKDFVLLDGTSPPIHRFNVVAPIQLTRLQQAAEYLEFFCSAVHSEFGAFTVVTNAGRAPLIADKATPEARAQLESAARPPVFASDVPDPDGTWHAKAVIRYGTGLFEAEFRIEPSGMITMLDDTPIVIDVPFLTERFEAGVRVWGPAPT